MTYKPNTNDRRVYKRITHAYGYVRAVFSETNEIEKSRDALNKHLGESSKELGKFLRKTLLVCTDHHYSEVAGKSKKYIINKNGCDYIRSLLMKDLAHNFTQEQIKVIQQQPEPRFLFDELVVKEFVKREYADELKSLNFNYEDKANRLWHPIQSIKRNYKKDILIEHGLRYHYDIRSCAPTLILQCAQKNGMDEVAFGIEAYLKNRTQFRDDITELAELSEEHGYANKTAKVVINALFCGARLGKSEYFALSRLLRHDEARIEFLKQYQPIIDLREDIKKCWKAIEEEMTRRSIIDKRGHERAIPLSSKQKWNKYFELERMVLNAAREYMTATHNKFFLEHDGWATANEIDIKAMQDYIKSETGYRVDLDVEVCE